MERVEGSDRRGCDQIQIDYLGTAACWLVARRVCTVGIDYLSVAGYELATSTNHMILLKAGIWVIEGLDLSGVWSDSYDLLCLPLKILGTTGHWLVRC